MLKLLLNEEIAPGVAVGLRRREGEMVVASLTEWEGGNFVGKEIAEILREAADQEWTLVTYDRQKVPLTLKSWTEEECLHGGVIFVDEKSIPPAETAMLISALNWMHQLMGSWEWTNRALWLG
ncbi:MAG: hypothetical protein WB424_18600 [Terracidiphilus sp.]